LSSPHGGKLVNRLADSDRCRLKAEELPVLSMSKAKRKDFECIAQGVFSPLEGPLNRNDYLRVLEDGRLESGVPWTYPIVLDVPGDTKYIAGDEVALSQSGELFGILSIEDVYSIDKKAHAKSVYRTLDTEHPGVANTVSMEDKLLGGKIEIFNMTPGKFPGYRLWPKETRYLFKEKGWRTIAGFQTRNAPHIGHEYVQKTALSFTDGLFINPLIGKKKSGDFTDEVIIDTYQVLFDNYYLPNSATLATLEMEMRYAGPREAILHAIARKNFGCTHFVVGRDHAGVGDYYGPYEAQEIFSDYPDLGIAPIFFRSFFHCNKCGGVQNEKICPHGPEHHVNFKGRDMRKLLMNGERPSEIMMRPEVVDAVLRYENPFVR